MSGVSWTFLHPADPLHTGTVSAPSPVVDLAPLPGDRPRRPTWAGVLTLLGSGTGNQVGAALGVYAYPAIGPVGVVAVRQFVAAAVLLPVARPNFRRFTWGQWWPALTLGLVFSVMNLSLYSAVDRIGLGLAITLEFLGPLGIALAHARSVRHVLCAVAAGVGVVVLIAPGPATDYLGVGLSLVAAVCWAAYILLNRVLGARLPGIQGTAAATTVSAAVYLPVAVVGVLHGRFDLRAVLFAVCTGLLCSALPYAADLIVLRSVPAQLFGILMSVNPVLAALSGIVLLGQVLVVHEWVGIAVVVAANVAAVALQGSVRTRTRRRRPSV
jgi:inner membrane transporter RhtA